MKASLLATLLAVLVAPFSNAAGVAKPRLLTHALGAEVFPSRPVTLTTARFEPLMTLDSAVTSVPEQVEEIRAWNRAGQLPAKNGFTRGLPEVIKARFAPVGVASSDATDRRLGFAKTAADGSVVWAASIEVRGAWRTRLHLTNVNVPSGTTFWVSSTSSAPIAFDTHFAGPSHDVYTPSIEGSVIRLDVEVPKVDREYGFDITEIVEMIESRASSTAYPATEDVPSCLADAMCAGGTWADDIVSVRSATAHLEFVEKGSTYVCTGTLIVNGPEGQDPLPFLLTANHCISDSATAATLEAFWDFSTASCNGTRPTLSSRPRTYGASLIATGTTSDFSLIRLSSVPVGPDARWFLGYTSQPVASGTPLLRVSHPVPYGTLYTQSYSTSTATSAGLSCASWPRPGYMYSALTQGGTYGGSSGSAAVTAGGYIVGQLTGGCGPHPSDGCDYSNADVDGAFAATYPAIRGALEWGGGAANCSCTPDKTTACLMDGRFKVTATFKDGFVNPPADRSALIIRYAENRPVVDPTYGTLGDLTFFALYDFAATKVEIMVKLYKGVTINDKYWVYVLGATDADFNVTITDTRTCQVWSRHNPRGQYMNVVDQNAFAFP